MSDGVNGNGIPAPERDGRGRFAPGTASPNPTGGWAAKLARKDVREAARKFTWRALTTLENIMDNPKAPHMARAFAANALLDRGWGKPPTMEIVAAKSEVTVRWLHDGDPDIDPAEAEVRARAKWIEHE